jgi:hypothetical protein
MDISIIHAEAPRNNSHPVWSWWDTHNDNAPATHKEMYYALRKYAESKFRSKTHPFTALYYIAACSHYPTRLSINTIRACDENVAWDIFHELQGVAYAREYHACALRSTLCKPLVQDVSEEVAPSMGVLRQAWLDWDEGTLAQESKMRVVPNALYADMRRCAVKNALCAACSRLKDVKKLEVDENPTMTKLDKKALTRLKKLVDELVYFSLSEVYPSPEFISAVFRRRKPILDALKHMRKPMMPEARLIFAKRVVSGVFDLVIACCLVGKGAVVRVMEYNHVPVTHINKRPCIRHN